MNQRESKKTIYTQNTRQWLGFVDFCCLVKPSELFAALVWQRPVMIIGHGWTLAVTRQITVN